MSQDLKEYWQVSESAAELYELYKVPRVFQPLAELMLEHAPPHAGHRVLDVACGTGIVARMAAARMDAAGRVIGLDFNQDMLAVARARTPSGAAQVKWRHGNAQAMPFEDSAFDRVYCQQGLQFFSDAAAALREMRRVLVPGGMAILSVWVSANPFNAALAEGLAKYAGADAATLSLKPFSLGDPLVLRRLVSGAGFSVVDMERGTITRYIEPTQEWLLQDTAGWPLAATVASMESSVRASMIREIATSLKPYWTGDRFAVPNETHLVFARK